MVYGRPRCAANGTHTCKCRKLFSGVTRAGRECVRRTDRQSVSTRYNTEHANSAKYAGVGAEPDCRASRGRSFQLVEGDGGFSLGNRFCVTRQDIVVDEARPDVTRDEEKDVTEE